MNDEQRREHPAPETPPTTPTDMPEAPAVAAPAKPRAKSGGTGAKKSAPKSDSTRARGTTKETARSSDDRVTGRTSVGSKQPSRTTSSKPKKEKIDLDSAPRSSRPAHRIIPFLLIGLAIFLGTCLILNLFSNWGNVCESDPAKHAMGSAGYYICYGLFGMFGPAAFALPLLILNMAFFWKAYVDHKLLLEKTIASVVALVFLSTLIHTCCLAFIPKEQIAMSASTLIHHGARMTGGGLLGGGIGYLLVSGLNVLGGILVSVFLTLLSIFFFLGMTPQHLMERIKAARSLKQAGKDPLGVDDNEPIIEQIRQRNKRAAEAARADEDTEDGKPPKGAVRPLASTAAVADRDEDDGLAPMPMPILDASDDSEEIDNPLFVPDDFKREAEGKERVSETARETAVPAKTPEPTPTAEAGKREEPPKAPTPPRTPITPPPRPNAPAPKKVPDSIESVFPRAQADGRGGQRIQKSDRSFELEQVFTEREPDRRSTPAPRKHAPLPPEVPMPGSSAARPSSTPAPAPQSTRPVSPTAPRPATPSAKAPAKATPSAGVTQPRPATGTTVVPRPAVPSAKQPTVDTTASKSPVTAASKGAPQKPVFRQAEKTANAEYGLSDAEFEKREAASLAIARATAQKSGAKKPTESKVPTGEKKPAASTGKGTGKQPAASDPKAYTFPPISYLHPGEPITAENQAEINANMEKLAATLSNFKVQIKEITYSCGPTVTRYEIFPDAGVRVRTITNLADDIALSFAVQGVRMEAIAGKSAIGVEVPNTTRSNIYLRDLLESKSFAESQSRLTAGLGADVTGTPLLFDISKMPHLLVAGTTGSGKSICINCIIMSILFKARPDEVKLILIDPKKVEFSRYKGLPHLMAPIIVTPKDAAGALQAAVEEMENRFTLIQDVGVNDITGYNKQAAKDPDLAPMPHVVIIIDELADLMMTARDEVEDSICRLAQKARAAGMHIIVGTQRPSVDVVTGLIKANIPSRIACTVRSQVDSRTILDFAGAEKLLGRGDMLFAPIGALRPTRVQGAFVSDSEVDKICEFIRTTNGTATYDENFTKKMKEYSSQCGKKGKSEGSDVSLPGTDGDNKYIDAIRIAIEEGRISTSLLQRKLGIGYSRAAKIIDRMEEEGLVSKPDGAKPRAVLITVEQFLERYVDGNAGKKADDGDEE